MDTMNGIDAEIRRKGAELQKLHGEKLAELGKLALGYIEAGDDLGALWMFEHLTALALQVARSLEKAEDMARRGGRARGGDRDPEAPATGTVAGPGGVRWVVH